MFKKKAPAGSFILAAVEAAAMLRALELQNGGLYTSPEMLKITTNSILKKRNIEMTGTLEQITQVCVMRFLTDQKFIDTIVNRATKGPIGMLTEADEKEIDRVVGDLLQKISGEFKDEVQL